MDDSVLDEVSCSVCGSTRFVEKRVPFGDEVVCVECKERYVQCLREGVTPSSQLGIWRDGDLLVVRRASKFPDFCVKCDSSANGGRKKIEFPISQSFKLAWGKGTFNRSVRTPDSVRERFAIGA